jgi:predicted nucleic acid-binding protein
MSAERYTLDTNVLFYAIDPDSGQKHRIASEIIATADYHRAILVLQCLGELYHAVSRKRPSALDPAREFILKNAVLFDVVHALPEDLADAIAAQQRHNLSFWDAMLWATAHRAGCKLILSEDMQDGRTLGGLTVRNPFVKGFRLGAL